MGNANLKTRRSRSWRDSQARKQGRIGAQYQREIANRARLKAGEPLPWTAACLERAARRQGLREIWLKRQKEEPLPAS